MKRSLMNVVQFMFICIIVLFPISSSLADMLNPSIAPALPPGGTWQYWDDGTVDPAHRTLNGVDILSATDGWAVGNQLIIHWNGAQWVKVDDPSAQILNDVVMSSSTDGWAIGEDGDILRWNGINWSLFDPIPENYGLKKLSKVAPNDIWASGYAGKILHWDGSQWTSITSQVTFDLNGISMVSASDGWAVGFGGQMIRWNGASWSAPIQPQPNSLYDVSMLSATDGWAVGNSKTVLRWNGSNWLPAGGDLFSDFSSLWMVKAVASNDVWASGFDGGWNVLYHWNGTQWFVYQNNTDNGRYTGIGFVPGTNHNEAWIVGDATTILHKGGTPYLYNTPYTKNLADVAMISNNSGWAVGTLFPIFHGDGLQWDGSTWKSQTSMDGYALSFSPGSNGNDGWEVGVLGELRHWDGKTWTAITGPQKEDLYDVDLLSSTDGWAVGGTLYANPTQSVILRLQGSTWTVFIDPVKDVLNAVDMVTSQDGWAAGENGTLLHWNGTAWIQAPAVTDKSLNAVSMISSTDGFAAGDSGMILRWDGKNWNTFPSPTTKDINAIQMLSGLAGWAVGQQQILYWDGTSWSTFPAVVYGNLSGLSMVSYYEGWAVGNPGTIMHFTAPPAGLAINYATGQPGSYFTLVGSNFPPNSVATISINGHILDTIDVDSTGGFTFLVSTTGAQNGLYYVTASVNPAAMARFVLDSAAPLRAQQGSGMIVTLPPHIAYLASLYLPAIINQ